MNVSGDFRKNFTFIPLIKGILFLARKPTLGERNAIYVVPWVNRKPTLGERNAIYVVPGVNRKPTLGEQEANLG